MQPEQIEMQLFLEALHQRYGYDLRGYSPSSIQRRLQTALQRTGCPHLGELQHRLLHDPQLLAVVLDALTVRVSELFRDPTFFATFRHQVVPLLKTYPQLKLWHAGCASGEEVYAMAILLSEENLYDRTQLYATDLSGSALEQAKAGTYSSTQLPRFEANYRAAGGTATLSDYYTEAYEGIVMHASLKRNVLFFQHNLVTDHVFGEMHAVICRNVLIYFAEPLRARVISKLQQSLCPGGFLGLGSSERVRPQDGFAVFAERDRIYRFEG